MKPPAFDYERPDNLRAALEALSKHGAAARLLAGGQSLIPMLNVRALAPALLIDVSRLQELQYISEEGGALRIGALTTHSAVLRSALVASACPILTEACAHVGSHAVRNRGTFGGSLCFNDPAAEMPLVANLAGATMIARSSWGSRTIPAAEFFKRPFETSLAPNEMLVEARIPRPPAGHGFSFLEVSQRHGDRALILAGCLLSIRYGVVWDVRIGFGNAGPGAARLRAAEAAIEGKAPSAPAIEAAVAAVAGAIKPEDDLHADVLYRRDVASTLTRRALHAAFARAGHPIEGAERAGRAS